MSDTYATIHPDDCEISLFDADPDGDPDRAGDGWYFRIPGQEGWSGPWHSEEEAGEELIDELEAGQARRIEEAFAARGYLRLEGPAGSVHFVDKADGAWHRVTVSSDRVTSAWSGRPDGSEPGSTTVAMPDDGRYGHLEHAVAEAIEAFAAPAAPPAP